MESILEDNVSSTVEKKPDNQCFLNIDSIQHITEPVVVLHDNIIFRINPAAEKIFNLNKERIIQCNFFDLIHPRDRERIISLYDSRTNLNQMVFHYHCQIVDKNETIKWIEVNSIKITSNEGEVYYNLIKEITDQIEKTQKQKILFELTPEAIFEFDLENRKILSINHAMAKRFQKKPEEMIGKNFLEFLPEDIYEKRFKIAEKAIRENRIITNFDTRNNRYFEDLYIPIFYNTRKKTLLGISKDITKYTRIEDDLKKSEKRFKEIFNSSVDAYLIVHPTDLTIIDGNIEAKNRFGLKPVDFGSMKIMEIAVSSNELNIHKSDKEFIDRILAGFIDKQDILLKTMHDGQVWHEIITKSVNIDGAK